MGLIQNPKTYSGRELEEIFFRPSFTGPTAEQLGIRVLYNMPMPTTVHLWSPAGDVLKNYVAGWQGGEKSVKQARTIDMKKVKAESAFSASDYFSMVFEQIANSGNVNMQDLSGTTLEAAETELFKKAVVESIRRTMWLGDTDNNVYNTFDGILKTAYNAASDDTEAGVYNIPSAVTADNVVDILDKVWNASSHQLRAGKADGELAFFVTTDICEAYERYLDGKGVDSSYREMAEGRAVLSYHGIPVIDICVGDEIKKTTLPKTICLLSDRRNLVLAVNTSDSPETEVRMWYNPDEMENRQRAVFLAGATVIDPALISLAYKAA